MHWLLGYLRVSQCLRVSRIGCNTFRSTPLHLCQFQSSGGKDVGDKKIKNFMCADFCGFCMFRVFHGSFATDLGAHLCFCVKFKLSSNTCYLVFTKGRQLERSRGPDGPPQTSSQSYISQFVKYLSSGLSCLQRLSWQPHLSQWIESQVPRFVIFCQVFISLLQTEAIYQEAGLNLYKMALQCVSSNLQTMI